MREAIREKAGAEMRVPDDWVETPMDSYYWRREHGPERLRALFKRFVDALASDGLPRERFGVTSLLDVEGEYAHIMLGLDGERFVKFLPSQAEALVLYIEAKRETLESS